MPGGHLLLVCPKSKQKRIKGGTPPFAIPHPDKSKVQAKALPGMPCFALRGLRRTRGHPTRRNRLEAVFFASFDLRSSSRCLGIARKRSLLSVRCSVLLLPKEMKSFAGSRRIRKQVFLVLFVHKENSSVQSSKNKKDK